MNTRLILALAACLVGCGKKEPADEPATPAQVITFGMAADRLPSFYDQGFVVSRAGKDTDKVKKGDPINQGDGLIWTGEAVYALDCARGAAPAAALAKMVSDTGGALYRHPSLADKISLDGALGFYRAVAKRSFVCQEGETWAPIVAMQVAYMDAHGGLLNAGDDATLSAGFTYVRDLLAWRLGVGGKPSDARQATLEGVVAGWAGTDIAAKAACFRTHLAMNTFQIMEELGRTISQEGRVPFCAFTKGANLPTTDHWCGRGGLDTWLTDFKWNVWQFRHQRCPKWESPDGNGDEQPAVDELVAWADLHGSPK